MKSYLTLQRIIYGSLLHILQWWQPIIVGEWSSVLPQRLFDSTPKHQHLEFVSQNVAAQQKIYRNAAAHIYWNYKAEGEGMWNFRSLVDGGIITPDDYI